MIHKSMIHLAGTASYSLPPQDPTTKVRSSAGRQDAGPVSIREGLTMARKPKKRGIFNDSKTPDGGGNPSHDNLIDKVADFSYSSDALAQLIAEMWLGQHANLTTMSGVGTTLQQYQARSADAKAILAARGIFLAKPIVITEKEYEDGFSLADAGLIDAATQRNDGIVFVLPDKERATTTILTPPSLLETAKMLMAVTPNGI
jgi:hypothetical protein